MADQAASIPLRGNRWAPQIDLTSGDERAAVPGWLAEVGQPYRANRAEVLLHDALALIEELSAPSVPEADQ